MLMMISSLLLEVVLHAGSTLLSIPLVGSKVNAASLGDSSSEEEIMEDKMQAAQHGSPFAIFLSFPQIKNEFALRTLKLRVIVSHYLVIQKQILQSEVMNSLKSRGVGVSTSNA
jgi:hypothetical protein